jgi:hypothetical protein
MRWHSGDWCSAGLVFTPGFDEVVAAATNVGWSCCGIAELKERKGRGFNTGVAC